jgi:hypothetical protein
MIDAIDRNVELQRQIALEPADVERQDERAIVVRDELRQTSQQLRALENLPRERSRRVVVRTQQLDPTSRVVGLRYQAKVVLQDLGSDGTRSHHDEPYVRAAKSKQQAQAALLQRGQLASMTVQNGLIEINRRNHEHRAGRRPCRIVERCSGP